MGAMCQSQPLPDGAKEGYEGTGKVQIHGMAVSGNVIPPCLFCLDNKCGDLVTLDFMKGEHKSEAKLKINPFGQMPSMKDGDFCLAESTAILRYLAKTYNPSTYGQSIKEQAECDWALDWAGTSFASMEYKEIWYPVAGFAEKPKDQAASNKAAVDKLEVFVKKFLQGKKFLGGNTLNIADYKFGTLVWYLSHPAIAQGPPEGAGYKNPPRIEQYVKDWHAELTPVARDFLTTGWGYMDGKLKK